VQGVWFRDSTRREAQALGITGYATNLANGDVEVLACGTQNALDRLHAWLRKGPPMAAVTAVTAKTMAFDETEQANSSFTIK
jgi:acylphosphatase